VKEREREREREKREMRIDFPLRSREIIDFNAISDGMVR
jgi:hypothetical protein